MRRSVVVLACAWVLWQYAALYPSEGPRPLVVAPAWHPLKAYSDEAACRYGETAAREISSARVICLPDTINPRGPKR